MGKNLLSALNGGRIVNSIKFSLVVYFLTSVGRDLTQRCVILRQPVRNVKAQKLQIEMCALINRDIIGVRLCLCLTRLLTRSHFFQLELALIDIET